MANTYTPNTKIRKGNDLMIFIGGKSVAFATSHQLSTTLESETIQSKDSGYDGVNIPKSITWEITSENLFIDGEYSKLFEKQLKKEAKEEASGNVALNIKKHIDPFYKKSNCYIEGD